MIKFFKWVFDKISDYPKIIKEIYLFFSYLKQITEEKHKTKFKRLKLRADWIGRVYTVVNLDENEAKWEEIEKRNLLLDKLKEINFYLTSLNVHEIISPNIRPVASFEVIDEEKEIIKKYEYAYLITYTFIFDKFNLWFLIKHIVLSLISYQLWSHYNDSIRITIKQIFEGLSVHLVNLF